MCIEPSLYNFRLNDPDRSPFKSVNDPRLSYLLDMAHSFDSMSGGRGLSRRQSLTTETKQAASQTLRGLVFTVKQLLQKGCGYIMLGMFQSDDLEGEFGALRQMSGGCYYISCEQVLCNSRFRQMKLYQDIQNLDGVLHTRAPCCEQSLTESEWDTIDNIPSLVGHLSIEVKSSLYYIGGYIAYSEGIENDAPPDIQIPESEFTSLVSRGRLTHPPEWVFSHHSLMCSSNRRSKCALIDLSPHLLQLLRRILWTYPYSQPQFPDV